MVDLTTSEHTHYTSDTILLPSDEVFALEVQDLGSDVYRLWLGTFNGLGYTDLSL